MPKFVKLHNESIDQEMGWRLKVESMEELATWNITQVNRNASEMYDIMSELHKAADENRSVHRICTEKYRRRDQMLQLAACKAEAKDGYFGLGDLAKLYDEMTHTKVKALNRDGVLYIAENNSFFTPLPYMKEVDEVESEDFAFPRDGIAIIEIKQWKNGNHYYVSDNDKPVTGDKYDDYLSAYNVADAYGNKNYGRKRYKVVKRIQGKY